jgi:hypothetical protein
LVAIDGNTAVANFASTSLAFTYHGNPAGNWFVIMESDAPVAYGTIAQWDTTTITDGNYDLRMIVTLTDSSQFTTIVEGLRVRNYSPVESDTPTPQVASATPLPPTPGETSQPTPSPSSTITATATVTPIRPSITPLPTNPLEISRSDILDTLGKGGLVTISFFIILGSYLAGRALLNRSPEDHRP